MLAADIPVVPDAPEARRWLLEELSRPEYREAEPTAFDLAAQAVRDWLAALLSGDWAVVDAGHPRQLKEASGLVAAYLAWHLERGLKSMAYVER